ncbi:hypothetical protein HL658_06580 [Azospirillum sp. RWY-5-1]|uniref:Uncharacterized protein n=1 Tax=Azospirillum oleiclasticum TaxID=2735135 RepID=A0ABX2T8U3_9PROT|nr:hypothetical protein [Azospirillum oleiclasticum]NYZ12209.1 hypothetical protein [Azospirillum oleiclasticum]NYZ19369.1 hypothetical protein [Azospirillum oleiclasticum]
MPQDFRPQRPPAEGIGFHELRQACEISALREDLERVLAETGDLRGRIEDSVEQVRSRFAALTPEELADSAAMAPLLQFAVAQLITIRDQARALRLESGPRPDEARPSWAAAYAPLRPSLVTSPRAAAPEPEPEPSPTPPNPPPRPAAPPPLTLRPEPAPRPMPLPLRTEPVAPGPVPLPLRAEAPSPPTPPAPDPAPQPPAGGWMLPSGTAPRRPAEPRREAPPGFVDWLRPARR